MPPVDPSLRDAPASDLLEAWFTGNLPASEGEALRARLAHDAAFRDTYRSFLAAMVADVWVPIGDVALEPDPSQPWFSLPLPHLGPEAALNAHRSQDGTTWSWPGAESIIERAASTALTLPGDETTGKLTIRLHPSRYSALDEGWRAVCAARALAVGEIGDRSRARELARAVREAMTCPSWSGYLQRAARAFEVGDEPTDDECSAVLFALEARVLMDDAAGGTPEPELMGELERIDACLDPFGDALLVLDPVEYRRVVGDRVLDTARWWGARARLDASVPEELLDGVLEADWRERRAVSKRAARLFNEVADRLAGWLDAARELLVGPFVAPAAAMLPATAVVHAAGADDDADVSRALAHLTDSPRDVDAVLRALHALPCPWLRPHLRAAVENAAKNVAAHVAPLLWEALGPRPGCVPVVAVDAAGNGHVLELRVREKTSDARGSAWRGELRATAQKAMLDGFQAVAARTSSHLPKVEFPKHAFDLIRPPELHDVAVDGDSLALSAAHAFASLWTGVPVRTDVVASARWAGRNLEAVGYVPQKAAAVLRAGGPECRFLLHPESVKQAGITGVKLVEVSTWEDGLREAGLLEPLRQLAVVSAPTMDVRRRLESLVSDVQQQKLADFEDAAVPGMGAWRALADSMGLLILWLEDNDRTFIGSELRPRARCHAALAYSYAGDPYSADDMLAPLPAEQLSPAAAALRDVVALSSAIGKYDWEGARVVRQRLQQATTDDTAVEVRGLVLGTLGRECVHRPDRDLDDAIRLLNAALAHHLKDVPQEAPRSRCYLANALRIAGRLEAAAEQIARGLDEIRHVRKASESYADTSQMFLRYEHARVLLDLERPAEAVSEALRALELARAIGWRPIPGALRVLIWSLRECGETDKANDALRVIETVVNPDREVDRRILEEARGPRRRDGEVF